MVSPRASSIGFALAAALLVACAPAGAAPLTTWFTLLGNPDDARADTVQIEPETVVVFSNLRTMRIRTSRGQERSGYDGRAYRSYVAMVHIDCNDKSARFRQIQLFAGPLWTGNQRIVNYDDAQMPPMAFRDMRPNPAERIVLAACTIDRVQSR